MKRLDFSLRNLLFGRFKKKKKISEKKGNLGLELISEQFVVSV